MSDFESFVESIVNRHYKSLKEWLESNGLRAPEPKVLSKLIVGLIVSDLNDDKDLFDQVMGKLAEELGLEGKPMPLAQEALFHIMRLASLAYIRLLTGLGAPRRGGGPPSAWGS